MALVFNSRRLCLDSNGNPVSGAKLYVYDATTVTPSSLFTSATLATPLANPVVADSSGVFPQIHMAEGAIVDTQTFTSGGVHLSNLDELSVIALGSNTGTLSRDFSNSRFQARGSGGTVYVEAGDPVGDDVGGTGVLGGWAGTQADSWAINAALVNIIGRLKEGGYKLPGVVRSEAVTFSAVASLDIPLTNDPTGTRAWDVDLIDLVLSTTSVTLSARFSFDGGSSYVATSTYLESVINEEVTTVSGTGSPTPATAAVLATLCQTPSNRSGSIHFRLVTPNSGSDATHAEGIVNSYGTNTAPQQAKFLAYNTTGGRATHIRILASGGTMAGIYRVTPLRGLGET